MDKYIVTIDQFSGPLELLLHLIKEKDLDLLTVDMAAITDQYLNYLSSMEQLNLEVASEYLVMAAYLLELKSKLLIPLEKLNADDGIDAEQERKELIARLVEYKKIKTVTNFFQSQEQQRQLLLSKEQTPLKQYLDELAAAEKPLKSYQADHLIKAINKMFARLALSQPVETQMTHQEVSPEERAQHILAVLASQPNPNDWVYFHQLFIGEPLSAQLIIITFIAILNLTNQQQILLKPTPEADDLMIKQVDKQHAKTH